MEEGVGFEPTEPGGPLVFKTSTLSQTLSPFQIKFMLVIFVSGN